MKLLSIYRVYSSSNWLFVAIPLHIWILMKTIPCNDVSNLQFGCAFKWIFFSRFCVSIKIEHLPCHFSFKPPFSSPEMNCNTLVQLVKFKNLAHTHLIESKLNKVTWARGNMKLFHSMQTLVAYIIHKMCNFYSFFLSLFHYSFYLIQINREISWSYSVNSLNVGL